MVTPLHCFWPWGEEEHLGKEHVIQQSCSFHHNQEATRETRRIWDTNEPFKDLSPVTSLHFSRPPHLEVVPPTFSATWNQAFNTWSFGASQVHVVTKETCTKEREWKWAEFIFFSLEKKRHFCLFEIKEIHREFSCDIIRIYVLKSKLVHLLYFSSFFLSPFLMVDSDDEFIFSSGILFPNN
jgi:hypothetical protein